MPTPKDRILWELERLPAGERMGAVVQVMQRLGMTTPPRPGALSRAGIGWLAIGVVVLGLATGMLAWRNTQARGRLQLATDPADARVFMDGEAVYDQPRTSITRRPGKHTLSVTMPGYTRSDQNIVLGTNRTLPVRVTLTPSADTGFEITSEPPAQLIWLDGDWIDESGRPARTPFAARGIAPGRHALELKESAPTFPFWHQVIEIEPDKITKVHAVTRSLPPEPHINDHMPSRKR